MQLHHSNSLTHSHSRTQSQSQSLPGSATIGHAHSYIIQSPFGAGHGVQQSSHLYDSPGDINDDMKAAGPVSVGSNAAVGVAAGMSAAAGVGLGIALSPPVEVRASMSIYAYIYCFVFKKGPPSRLLLSPSNGALKESAAEKATAIAVNGEDEDRGHIGDVRCKSHSLPVVLDY